MGVKVRFNKGSYWIYVNHKGNRKSKPVGSLRAAEKVADELRQKLAKGDFGIFDAAPAAPPLTVRAYSATWLRNAEGRNKRSTLAAYSAHLDRHILPLFGDRALSSITRDDCKELVNVCRRKMAARGGQPLSIITVTGILRAFSSLLTQAADDGLREGNPAERLGRHIGKDNRPKFVPKFLTASEVARLVDAARFVASPQMATLILLAVRTGLRLGELMGLQWGDIDLDRGYAMVRRSWKGGHTTTTKSGKARRVELSPDIAGDLHALSLILDADAPTRGWAEKPVWVFTSSSGRPADSHWTLGRYGFHAVLKEAGLPMMRFHDLRHTFASLLIAKGAPLVAVRDLMGHASIMTTANTYGHLYPNQAKEAVASLDHVAHLSASPAHPEILKTR